MRFTPKQPHNPKQNIFWLVAGLIFTFTVFILIIVATAGSTSNYTPINNVYLGDANIAHINVSKVIPQMKPILTILGSALTAPNQSLDNIFGALKTVSTTPALTSLLLLLANAANTTTTIKSLTNLAPLALEGDPTESTKELVGMSGLVKNSNNGNQTLKGLGELIVPTIQNFNDTQLMTASGQTLQLLSNSDDPLNSTQGLKVLNNMTLSEKASLLPVFSLYQSTNNVTQLNQALLAIMQSADAVPPQQAANLLDTLSTMLASSTNSNLTQTFEGISRIAPQAQQPAIRAIQALLESSSNVNSTLSTLSDMVEANITSSESAQLALPAMVSIISNSNNVTTDLNIIRSLALVRNTTATSAQLLALEEILDTSTNQKQSVSIIDTLQHGLSPNSSTIKYIPSLFTLMNASANPESTFSSLVTLTSWAQENPSTFEPIVKILSDASSVEPISETKLKEMTPILLQYLKIAIYYRLSIFTLCKGDINNDIISCNAPHAVQDLDFRNIIYDALIESDFQPYMRGLNITANDLHLDGDLLNRQHEYVPAVKSVLAMNILTIITAATVLCLIIYILFTGWRHMWVWYTTLVCCFFVGLFSGIGATINAVMIEIIKSGTHHDDYGVVYETGSPYAGLTWTSFVLACFTFLIVALSWWNARKYLKSKAAFADSNEEEITDEELAGGDVFIVKTKSEDDDNSMLSEKDAQVTSHIENARNHTPSSTTSAVSSSPAAVAMVGSDEVPEFVEVPVTPPPEATVSQQPPPPNALHPGDIV
ncbi:hypothetical protein MOSE0_M11188 [Monosporozyma servazzii]